MRREQPAAANENGVEGVLDDIRAEVTASMKHARLRAPDRDILIIEWLGAGVATLIAVPPFLRGESGLGAWLPVGGATVCVLMALAYQFCPRLWRINKPKAAKAKRVYRLSQLNRQSARRHAERGLPAECLGPRQAP